MLSNQKIGHHKLTFPIFRSVILSVFWEKAWSREKKISLDYYFNRKVKVFFETPGEHLGNEVKYFRRKTSTNIDIDVNTVDWIQMIEITLWGGSQQINYDDYGILQFYILNFRFKRTQLCQQAMLTTRNIFIANLAVSDILLCSFSMPLTLADILTNYWTFGTDFVSFPWIQYISMSVTLYNLELDPSYYPNLYWHWLMKGRFFIIFQTSIFFI